MSDTKKNIQIANYLVKYMQDECDEDERLIVEEWLNNSKNKELFKTINDENAQDVFDKHDLNFSHYKNDFNKALKKRRNYFIYRRFSYILLFLFVVSIPFLFLEINNSKITVNKKVAKIEKKNSSDNLPILYTSDGEKIALGGKAKVKSIKENNGVIVNICLLYTSDAADEEDSID